MSDKAVLCLACGSYAAENSRVGGPGQPYTYHQVCARVALAEAEAEFTAAGGRGVELAEEIDWLRRHIGN